jgi:polyisoprenoid-binding protein YceI
MIKRLVSILFLVGISAAAQSGPTSSYPVDINHSTVGFSVPILNGLSRVSGKFADFSVTLNHDDKEITKSSVSVTIKATSIDTGIAARDNHLRSADFFDVEKFPDITFQSTRIEKNGKQLLAIGTLTMHGVAKEITLPFTIVGVEKNETSKKMVVGYSASLTLNRRDFGINWTHKTTPNFVGDNIDIQINLITKAIELK